VPLLPTIIFAIGFGLGLLFCVAPSSQWSLPLLRLLMRLGKGSKVGPIVGSRNGVRLSGILIMLITLPMRVAAFMAALR